jgi:alkaline phosphatase D
MNQFAHGRRVFLAGVGASASLAAFARRASAAQASALFTLGVASGDPGHDAVTLWTRLAPKPLEGGGMTRDRVFVEYEVAEDERMRRVVRRGVVVTDASRGHSVLVRVEGLRADRWYFYRFRALGDASRVGRTRTFPRAGDECAHLRFALASCQDYQNGYYAAYRDMAEQDLDCVVHVGDYIYEYGAATDAARPHVGDETQTLVDYRNRYAQYRLDPDLQEVHARFPFIVTWDDHEVDNNYAGEVPEDGQTREEFLTRRAAAYQAYVEHMPLALKAAPSAGSVQLYRALDFGRLARFNVLDTRQFRTDQPCGDGFKYCPDVFSATASLTGVAQMRWLERSLTRSSSRWNVIAQQVMMTQWDGTALTGFQSPLFNVDAWDGYQASRSHLLDLIGERGVKNTVVLSGDIHSSWVADLKRDFADVAAAPVATEFVGTSISSDFPASFIPIAQATLPANPHIRFFDGAQRGYVVCDVNAQRWQSEFRAVADVRDPESAVDTLAHYVVESGRPGAQVG